MGFDDAGGHAVHPDVALRQLGGQRAGQTHQGRLTHAVRTQALQKRQKKTHKKVRIQSCKKRLRVICVDGQTCIGW